MAADGHRERDSATDEELKHAVKDRTPAGTQEIADYVGMSRQGVEYRLKQFHDRWQHPVWSKKVGPTRVWMHHHRIWMPGWPQDRTLHQEDVLRTDHTYLRSRTQPKRIVDQREVVQAVYRVAPASTQEVADLIGISRQGIGHRLRALDYREKIWSKKVGPTMVWIHPQIMDDPDPGRETSADDVAARIFGDVYQQSKGRTLRPKSHSRVSTNGPHSFF